MAKMKYIIPLICCGSPALAHHEVVVVSFLPGISIWIISTFAAFEPEPSFPTSAVFRAGLAAFTKLFADQYADGDLAADLESLNQSLYGDSPDTPNLRKIARGLSAARSRYLAETEHEMDVALPPLNP